MNLKLIKRYDEIHDQSFFDELRTYSWPEFVNLETNDWIHRFYCKAAVLETEKGLQDKVIASIWKAGQENFSNFIHKKNAKEQGILFIVVTSGDEFIRNKTFITKLKEAIKDNKRAILNSKLYKEIYISYLDSKNAEKIL